MSELLRQLVEFSPDAQLVVTDGGIIAYANAYAHALFGYPAGSLNGMTIESLVPSEVRAEHAQHRHYYGSAPTLREMGARDARLSGLRHDGTTFPAQIRLAPITTAEGTVTAVVVRDVSQLEATRRALDSALRAAEEANEIKSRFLAAASHDLRQPLQSLRLINATLRRQAASADVRELLESEARTLDTMSQLVNALLNVVKLESGAMVPHFTDLAMASLFDDLRRQFVDLAAAKGVGLEVEAPNVFMRTDATLMRELLQNLIANAIRYTDSGRVALRLVRLDDSRARIEVEDTGMGMAPEVQERIFDDFYQIPTLGSEPRGGFGLGLGIVRRVAQLLELPLGLKSCLDRGTTFTAEVSVYERCDSGPPDRAPLRPRLVTALNILLVEDEAAVRSALKIYLELEGHSVKAVGTLTELDLLLADLGAPPHLIITDFKLGPIDRGTDAMIRLESKFSSAIPAIVLTGDTSRVPAHVLRAGRTKLLNKPIDGDALLKAVSDLLGPATGAA